MAQSTWADRCAKYSYGVVELQHRNRFVLMIRTVIALVLAGITSLAAYSPARAGSDELKINQVAVSSSNGTSHRVELQGTYSTDIESSGVRLDLVTYGPLRSRIDLSEFLANPNKSIGQVQSTVSIRINKPEIKSKNAWRLKFNGEQIFGAKASGVYLVGVKKRGSTLQTNYVLPWFYNGPSVKKTNVIFLTQLAVQDTHLADRRMRYINRDAKNLTRLNGLVEDQVKGITYLFDNGVTNWLVDLAPSALGPAADDVTSKLAKLSGQTELQVYNHTNLQGVLSGSPGDLPKILKLSGFRTDRSLYYLPKYGQIDSQTLSGLGDFARIVPILSNTFVSGNANNTASAIARVNDVPSIIYDAATSRCLSISSADRAKACLAANIAMITSEAPYSSRTIAILTPPFWQTDSGELADLVRTIQTSRWGQIVEVPKNLQSDAAIKYSISGTASTLPKVVVKNSNKLLREAQILGDSIADPSFISGYELARLRSYFELYPEFAGGKYFLETNQALLDRTRKSIAIRTSTRITVATSKTDIPLTISNQSGYPIKVKAQLTSAASSQFAKVTTGLIEVPNNQRITVPVTVELAGTGNVSVAVNLLNTKNQKLGISQNISLTSSSYQSLARTLVWGACGLLLLFAIVNVARKKWRPETADE